MSYVRNLRIWFRGLAAAFLTGGSTAVLTALSINAADGIGAGVGMLTYKQFGAIVASGAIVGVCAYLQRSPLPEIEDEVETIPVNTNLPPK